MANVVCIGLQGVAKPWVPPRSPTLPFHSTRKASRVFSLSLRRPVRRVTQAKAIKGNDLLQKIESYRFEEETESGVVVVEPLTERWIPKLADLLVESFGGALGYKGMSEQLFRLEILSYLKGSLKLGAAGVVLVASLEPNDEFTLPIGPPSTKPKFKGFTIMPQPGEISTSPPKEKGLLQALFGRDIEANLPKKSITTQDFRKDLDSLGTPEQPSIGKVVDLKADSPVGEVRVHTPDTQKVDLRDRKTVELETSPPSSIEDPEALNTSLDTTKAPNHILLGTTELSLDNSTRQSFFGLINPVKDGAYISNVAVTSAFQRKGHATRMIKAAEEITRLAGFNDLYVQARVVDKGPQALYRGYGFQQEKYTDILNAILNGNKKILLRKRLQQSNDYTLPK